MNKNDTKLFERINIHYNELQRELTLINHDKEEFLNNAIFQKAILFDLFQICELYGKFSASIKKLFKPDDLKGMRDLRNFIVHAYGTIDHTIAWDAITKEIPLMFVILNKNRA